MDQSDDLSSHLNFTSFTIRQLLDGIEHVASHPNHVFDMSVKAGDDGEIEITTHYNELKSYTAAPKGDPIEFVNDDKDN